MPLDLAPSREGSRLRSTRTGNIVRGRNARGSDDPVDRAELRHGLSLGAPLFDHDLVESLDRIAAGGDAPAGDDRLDERAQAAPDHRHPASRRKAETLPADFTDALRMAHRPERLCDGKEEFKKSK